MPIPDEAVILLSGVPATGKSSFGQGLARHHGFAHYDLECHPHGWPRPGLKSLWDADVGTFVAELKSHHRRVVLDWGFPPRCDPTVQQLQGVGVRLIWFDGDRTKARQVFLDRGGIAVANFDGQLDAIKNADYPSKLKCDVVRSLSVDGSFLSQRQLESAVFP